MAARRAAEVPRKTLGSRQNCIGSRNRGPVERKLDLHHPSQGSGNDRFIPSRIDRAVGVHAVASTGSHAPLKKESEVLAPSNLGYLKSDDA